MKITENEFSALIRESSPRNFVEGAFGVGFVTLKDTRQNQWAIERVKQMRDDNCGAWFDGSCFDIQNPL